MSHSLHGVGVGPCTQFKRLGQNARRRSLADAASAGEQIGVADAAGRQLPPQRPGDVLLADQFVKRLRPIAPGNDNVFPSRPLDCILGRNIRGKDFVHCRLCFFKSKVQSPRSKIACGPG